MTDDGEPLDDAVEDDLAVEPRDGEHHVVFLAPEEHRPRQVVAFHQVADLALEAHTALLEEDGPVRDRRRHVEGLLHDDQGLARRLQPVDDLDQLLDDDRGQAERQLVDHEHRGVVQHGDGQREHLLLPTRERVRPLAAAILDGGKELVDPLCPAAQLGAIGAVDEPAHLEVLRHRHGTEDAFAARQEVDAEARPLFRRGVGDVPAVEPHRAARRRSPGRRRR